MSGQLQEPVINEPSGIFMDGVKNAARAEWATADLSGEMSIDDALVCPRQDELQLPGSISVNVFIIFRRLCAI